MPLSPQITITPEDIVYKSFDITAVSYTSTTATYTATGHTLSVGNIVQITGIAPDGYNGTYTITGVASNTFTVANTTNTALTDQSGNVYWAEPTEYEYDGGQTVAFRTNNLDISDPVVNPAIGSAAAALAQANTAIANANTALSQATIAYNAAIGSLQPSASTIVNASNQITAISTNGITVYSGSSATSGARVVMNSVGIAGYDSSGSATFAIVASTGAASFKGSITGSTITGSTLNISGNFIVNSSGYLTATGATITGAITATSGSFTGSVYATTGNIGGWNFSGTALYTGTVSSPDQYLNTTGGGLLTGGYTIGSVGTVGNVTVGADLLLAGSVTSANFNLSSSTELRVPFAYTNTTTNAATVWISSTGQLRRSTASSERYKTDIVDLVSVPELDPKALYSLPVRAFRFKPEYLPTTDDRSGALIPGFIAEEVDAIYPIVADYIKDNGVESWNDRLLVPALLALVQDLNNRLKTIEGGN